MQNQRRWILRNPSIASPWTMMLILLLCGKRRYYVELQPPNSFSLFFFCFLLMLLSCGVFSSLFFIVICSPFATMITELPPKAHAVISYIPAVTIRMLVLSFSQKKWSGTVLAVYVYQGMKPPGLIIPDCQSHLPRIFSEHSVSLMVAWSFIRVWRSASVTFSAKASFISRRALLTSSISIWEKVYLVLNLQEHKHPLYLPWQRYPFQGIRSAFLFKLNRFHTTLRLSLYVFSYKRDQQSSCTILSIFLFCGYFIHVHSLLFLVFESCSSLSIAPLLEYCQ